VLLRHAFPPTLCNALLTADPTLAALAQDDYGFAASIRISLSESIALGSSMAPAGN
jgi:hypothetical protein